jgi:DNA-binding NtrC family response regulator
MVSRDLTGDGATTRPSMTLGTDTAPAPLQWLCTLAFHPQRSRIGEVAAVVGDRLLLGRQAPAFKATQGAVGVAARGIADPWVSRSAVSIEPSGGGWRLTRLAGASRLRLDGDEVEGDVLLARRRLEDGVVLLLGQRVLICLRLCAGVAPVGKRHLGLLGQSPATRELRRALLAAAATDSDVLLLGPSGTGKELAARAIHANSARRRGAWIAVNMAALAPELAAAALFGSCRGAFTGADRNRPGYFQQAQGGTLFLDEIGDTPAAVQPLLLRALQEREVQVVGGSVERVDVRVIAATELDLEAPEGGFRSALRYRLGARELRLAPLTARREDIGPLAAQVLRDVRGAQEQAGAGDSDERETALWARFFESLHLHPWPGNVRELQHRVRQAAEDRAAVPRPVDDRAARDARENRVGESAHGAVSVAREEPEAAPPGSESWRGLDDDAFMRAWREARFEVAAMARRYGVSRTAVYRRLRTMERCRLASDVPLGELLAALDACRGDLRATAERLAVSSSGLKARLRASGLETQDAAHDAG